LSKSIRTRRFLGGLALVLVILIFAFSLLPLYNRNWGSTAEEVALSMPGDDVLSVLSTLAFTFLQPPTWIRVLVDAALLGTLTVYGFLRYTRS
jgi:hypothetical protein